MEDLVRIINEDSNSENDELRNAIYELMHTEKDLNNRIYPKLLTNIELIYYYKINDYRKAYLCAKEAFEMCPYKPYADNLKYCEQALNLEPKIIVYAIMNNEIHNIESWLENIKNADNIYVLDTGSTDGSWEKINDLKSQYSQLVTAQKIYDDFRYDVARNDCLSLVPNEPNIICWALDLNERFNSNWYEITKSIYLKNRYFYRIGYLESESEVNDGYPEKSYQNKCHQRLGAHWILPVSEQLFYNSYNIYYDGGGSVYEDEILVYKYSKPTENTSTNIINDVTDKTDDIKNKFSSLYDSIINNDKNIDILLGEIAQSMEIINPVISKYFYELSIELNPFLRTNYIKYANFMLYLNSYENAINVINAMESARTFKQPHKDKEEYWKELPYLLKAIAYENLNLTEDAKENYSIAKKLVSKNSTNYDVINQKCNKYNII